MKSFVLFAGVMLIVILGSTISCVPSRSEQQLARIEAELSALKNTLLVTQQELVATKKALSEAQEQTQLIQQKLQEALKPAAAPYIVQQPQVIEPPVIVQPPLYPYPPYNPGVKVEVTPDPDWVIRNPPPPGFVYQ